MSVNVFQSGLFQFEVNTTAQAFVNPTWTQKYFCMFGFAMCTLDMRHLSN